MRTLEIRRKEDGSTYRISASNSGFVVEAVDAEDAGIAAGAQLLVAGRWNRNAYSPALGDPLAAAAAMAASILGGEVVGEIPGGRGELEQSGDYRSSSDQSKPSKSKRKR